MERFVRNGATRTTRAVLVCLGLAACSDASGPVARSFEFSVERLTQFQEENAVVTGGDGSITVLGHLSGSACGRVGGALYRAGERDLSIVVTQYVTDQPCVAVVIPIEFKASAGELEAGHYHVQILLTGSPVGTPRTVYDEFVDVS